MARGYPRGIAKSTPQTTKKAPKVRADLRLVQQGLADSRHQALGMILAGQVFSGEERVEKAGDLLRPEDLLTVRESPRFVSRGGIKLDHALSHFGIDPKGWVAVDVGASTGGFTDCLLQRGARKVYAVDVGWGQFHWRLRGDPRIVLLEKTNIRQLGSRIPEPCDLGVVDVSFVSLTKVLPHVVPLIREEGSLVVLVKPQFELGPRQAKKGVVRDPEDQRQAVRKVEESALRLGLEKRGETPSPILGPKGNQEQFLYLRKPSKSVG